jgi:hypothetical protein
VFLAVVLKVGQVGLPDISKATAAMSAVAAADREVRSGKLVVKSVETVLGAIFGNETPDKMVSLAEKAVTDSAIKKAIEKETGRSLKKHKLWK